MKTTVTPVNLEHPEAEIIADAAERLARGELVVFPTETVYGLGAHALDIEAVARMYAAKGRPAWNPVISHVANAAAAQRLTRHWSADAQKLADAFWPGPLTLVLPKAAHIPDISTAGLDAIAVRVPRHPVALALLTAFGGPVAAPSANRFMQLSPTSAAHALEALGGSVSCILDGGPCDVGIESTVVSLVAEVPVVLRPGMITVAQLEDALGKPVAVGSSIREQHERPLSPGSADRHYAPRADVWIVDTDNLDEIVLALRSSHASGSKDPANRPAKSAELTVALVFMNTAVHAAMALLPVRVVHMPSDAVGYARTLYGELHAADESNARRILVERPPATDEWRAVQDRLTRASKPLGNG